LRSNTKGYGSKTHQTCSQNNDTTALSGRELYHLQLSLQAASPETFRYTRARARACVYRLCIMYVRGPFAKFMYSRTHILQSDLCDLKMYEVSGILRSNPDFLVCNSLTLLTEFSQHTNMYKIHH
jgi:hypothetical protein